MSTSRRTHATTRRGGNISLCTIPGVLSTGNAPIHTELLGGVPGGGEMLSIVAITGILATAGRWAYQRFGGDPDVASAEPHLEVASDSDALWRELEPEREAAGV